MINILLKKSSYLSIFSGQPINKKWILLSALKTTPEPDPSLDEIFMGIVIFF